MARHAKRLTSRKVAALTEPGEYADGDRLYLSISRRGSKSWSFRYRSPTTGKMRQHGLGPVRVVSLAQAREKAKACAELLLEGIDPIEQAAKERQARRIEGSALTFEQAVKGFLETNSGAWANSKHAAQWRSTLETYALPIIGSVKVKEITVPDVLRVLEQPHPETREQLWRGVPETASRLRGRVERVLRWAESRGHRESGTNPAAWRTLKDALPPVPKAHEKDHYAAMPYAEIPALFDELRARHSAASCGLMFVILTATRVSEALKAEWPEIDLSDRLWTIPAHRMKARRAHRVPLSQAAVAVLKQVERRDDSRFVFPGYRDGRPLSDSALRALLARSGHAVTVHGFRSSFADWIGEQTNASWDVREQALAHRIPDKAERAYFRTDLLERRRALMERWGEFCTTPRADSSTVVPLRAAEQ